jgi:hypothetical protein
VDEVTLQILIDAYKHNICPKTKCKIRGFPNWKRTTQERGREAMKNKINL